MPLVDKLFVQEGKCNHAVRLVNKCLPPTTWL